MKIVKLLGGFLQLQLVWMSNSWGVMRTGHFYAYERETNFIVSLAIFAGVKLVFFVVGGWWVHSTFMRSLEEALLELTGVH